MALFSTEKKKEATKTATKAKKAVAVITPTKAVAAGATFSRPLDSSVIIRPRVTEKAAMLSEQGRTVVVFEVAKGSNKRAVSDAIRNLYKVVPEKIAVLRVPPKKSFVRGRVSYGKTSYKAYVYLKKGETIEVI